jgi:ABC-type phosphate transport system permease subunit
MGGLAAGSILTLMVVPVFYAMVERTAEKVKARLRRIITRGESDPSTEQA